MPKTLIDEVIEELDKEVKNAVQEVLEEDGFNEIARKHKELESRAFDKIYKELLEQEGVR